MARELDSSKVFFVTRLKSNVQYDIIAEYYGNKLEGDEFDCDVTLTGVTASRKYPKTLRLVRVYDEANAQWLTLVTNNRSWTAATISELYRARWDVETFFKTIKQTLKIKTFLGTSENAVLVGQVWTAMIAILLIRYLKARAKHRWHLSNLVGFLRLNLFVKIDLWTWIDEPVIKSTNNQSGQLSLLSG